MGAYNGPLVGPKESKLKVAMRRGLGMAPRGFKPYQKASWRLLLSAEAANRGTTPQKLKNKLLQKIAEENLYTAVLDE